MSVAEWALRSLPHHWYTKCQSIVETIEYGKHFEGKFQCDAAHAQPEWYYMQAQLQGDLLNDLDVQCGAVPLLKTALLHEIFASSCKESENLGLASVKMSQAPRLWLSPGGAVSPLHFDLSLSHLVQLHGAKNMTFYNPGSLSYLHPFPAAHMLARRCTVDGFGHNWDRPSRGVQPLEAIATTLFPGDIVLFAPLWSHHTISMSPSASVTFRVQCS